MLSVWLSWKLAPRPIYCSSGDWEIEICFRVITCSPIISTRPEFALSKFGGGRLGEVCFAADIPVGIAGCREAFTARVLEADIPAQSRKGALEALGGQLDFFRDMLTIRRQGLDVPLKESQTGH